MEIPNEFFKSLFIMYLEEFERINEHLKNINKMLVGLVNLDQYKEDVALLRTVPGVESLSAITFLLEIGDFSRFTSAEKFASYLLTSAN